MSDNLERRLRAHFADRAAATFVPPSTFDGRPPTVRPSLWRRPVVLAAAAVTIALAAGAVAAAVRDDDATRLTTTTPSPTTTGGTALRPTTTVRSGAGLPSPTLVVVVAAEGILGWWDGTKWVRSAGRTSPPARAGDRYRIVRLDEAIRTVSGSAPQGGCELGDALTIEVGLSQPEDPGWGRQPVPVAVGGVHDPRPRPVTAVDPSASVYREAAREVLSELGVDDPDPEVVLVARSDLDGDGADEALVVVQRLGDPNLYAREGDYSVVFLRQVDRDTDRVRNSVVVSSVADSSEDATPYVGLSTVSAVVDLNGDGRMEVVASGRYYEGSGTAAYELVDGRLTEVLAVGCGA